MLLASYLALQTQPTQRVNIQFLAVTTDMGSIQRLSRLSLVILACLSLKQCHITDLLTMALPTMALLIFSTMPLPHPSNSTGTAWAITWLDKARITLYHPIMHLRTWLIDQ